MTKNSIVLWQDIHEVAQKVCKHYNMSYGKIIPETRKQTRHYGECRPCDKCANSEYINEINCNEKILSIRIHQLNKPRTPLESSTIINTLAHELAHLREWKEGRAHKFFENEIIQFIKELGYLN